VAARQGCSRRGEPVKETIRRIASRVLVGSGTTAVARRLFPKNGTVILYGHRVQPDAEGFLQGLDPEWLREQLGYLVRNYRPMALSELVDCFEADVEPPSGSFVVTFDDGFRDNLTNALPVLEELGVPATIFLVTECADTGALPWPQRLGYMLQHSERPVLLVDRMDGGPPGRLSLGTGEERRKAFWRVFRTLKPLGRTEREGRLALVADQLGVEPPRDRMLSWEDARRMQETGLVEFGGHTVSHPWMAHLSLEEARWELETCREALWRQLGIEHPSFAFPGGSFNPRLVELVREVGFRSVFQSRPGLRLNSPATTNRFALSRIGLPNAPAHILEAELDGPFHAVRRLYRRDW